MQDKDRHRTISVSGPDMTADALHKITISSVAEAIKKASPGKYDDPAQEHYIDKYWRITDVVAVGAEESLEGKEDVIAEGSAAWYHLK